MRRLLVPPDRSERYARDDDNALARAGEALDIGMPAGAVGHVALVACIVGHDRIYAPDDGQPPRDLLVRGQRQDGGARSLTRDSQAQSSQSSSRRK